MSAEQEPTDAPSLGIAALILHFNGAHEVGELLADLDRQVHPPATILVMDNASRREERSRLIDLCAAFGRVEVVQRDDNGGYAAAMNDGIELLRARGYGRLVLLTQDARLDPDVLERLGSVLDRRPEVAIVGPLLGHADARDQVFSAGGTIAEDGRLGHVGEPAALSDWADEPARRVDWLDGAVLLLRADALPERPFFEGYFLYFEEVDLQHRLAREGWEAWLEPAARAWQRPGSLTPYLGFRNRVLFQRRTMAGVLWRPLIADAARFGSFWTRAGRPSAYVWVARGILDGARGRTGPPPQASTRLSWAPDQRRGPRDAVARLLGRLPAARGAGDRRDPRP